MVGLWATMTLLLISVLGFLLLEILLVSFIIISADQETFTLATLCTPDIDLPVHCLRCLCLRFGASDHPGGVLVTILTVVALITVLALVLVMIVEPC
jgi:hypothetical protein